MRITTTRQACTHVPHTLCHACACRGLTQSDSDHEWGPNRVYFDKRRTGCYVESDPDKWMCKSGYAQYCCVSHTQNYFWGCGSYRTWWNHKVVDNTAWCPKGYFQACCP